MASLKKLFLHFTAPINLGAFFVELDGKLVGTNIVVVNDALLETPNCLPQKSPKTRPMRSSMYGEARELQMLLLNDARDASLKPFVRSQLARAYKELAELRLRLQGKGPPKAVDYSTKAKRSKPGRGFVEAQIVASETTTSSVPDKTA